MLFRILLLSLSLVISSAYAATDVNLGVIYDAKDPQQMAAWQGVQLAVSQSQHDKKSDYKFSLIGIDASTTQSLIIAANNLQDKEKLPVILGLGGNAQITILAPIILSADKMARNKVLISADATSVDLLKQYAQQYFSVSASENVLAGAAAQFILNQLHRERVLVLYQNNNQSKKWANYFAEAFTHIQGNVALNKNLELGVTPELVEAIHAARGRVIYLAASNQEAIAYIKQLRQAGIKLPIMLSADLNGMTLDKNWAEGVFYTTQTYFDKNFESDEMTAFLKQYNEQYKKKPSSTQVVLGYDATLLAIMAIRQADSLDADKIAQAIKKMQMFPAASGLMNFVALTPLKVVTIIKITNGKTNIAAMSRPQYIAQ
ncbi:MAG: hypothetical protein EXR81_04415 [Gammaproteobacteria bacterium]|nr:hypothetical protein [Gammaproteobacteria bacterium]